MSTLEAARDGDEQAFAELVAAHRRELYAHCYRMLGSVQDAEEALQETLLAAWRGLRGFEERSSLRTWLHRIATTCCLRLASRRPTRLLSWDHGGPRAPGDDLGAPVTGPVWLEPCLDDRLLAPDDADPAAAYRRRESVELAYVAALQHLPANQRAVLILREVLAFSAAEVAEMLDTSPQSVNSALQRARRTLAERLPGRSQQDERLAVDRRGSVGAFVEAFVRGDVPALVELLAEGVRFTMPPLPAWFDGRDDVAEFFASRVFASAWQAVPIGLNGQPGIVGHQLVDGVLRPGAVMVLGFQDGEVNWIASFLDPAVLARLDLSTPA